MLRHRHIEILSFVAFLAITVFVASPNTLHAQILTQNCAANSIPTLQWPSPHSGALDPTGKNPDQLGSSILYATGSHNTIVIMQTAADGSNSCHSISSNRLDGHALFVPWRSPNEWSQFLVAAPTSSVQVKVGSCCPPLTFQVCGASTDINGNLLTPINLGYKILGTPYTINPNTNTANLSIPLVDGNNNPLPNTLQNVNGTTLPSAVLNWGAENDHFGPVCAANILGTASIDYQVEWVCSGGTWIKSREVGSCTPLNGSCALSAGSLLNALPSDLQSLCGTGSIFQNLVTQTTGAATTGWTWDCAGTQGMTTANCSAVYAAAADGVCGTDYNAPLTTLTSSDKNLCSVGNVSAFSGTGPWSWQCLGIGGGAIANCATVAPTSIIPACGPADTGSGSYSMAQLQALVTSSPSTLCSAGTFDSNQGFDGGQSSAYIFWHCIDPSGLNHGVGCNTTNSVIDGACGSAAGLFNLPANAPVIGNPNLCENNGSTPSATITIDPIALTWTWTCAGTGGGSTATCVATYNPLAIPGQCGAFQSGCAVNATTPGLCANGTPAQIVSQGSNFYWVCSGAAGAASQNCQAVNTCAAASCGSANGTPTSITPPLPQNRLCTVGTASAPQLSGSTWSWVCSNGANPTASCTAPSVAPTAACGLAVDTPSALAPTISLCGSGSIASTATVDSSGTLWQWVCHAQDGSSVSCSTTDTGVSNNNPGNAVNGACGVAINSTSVTAPVANLCSAGGVGYLPAPDATNTKWTWTCAGTNGGTSITCESPMSLANGQCGPSNGTFVNLQPTNCPTCNLCNSGQASAISGTTTTPPWTWTCLGLGGGSNSSLCQAFQCSACSGSINLPQTLTYTGSPSNGCHLTLSASWTEIDNLSTSGLSSYTISWVDPTGAQSNLIASSTSAFCSPCGATVSGVSGFTLTIAAMNGNCSAYTVGQTLPISGLTAQ